MDTGDLGEMKHGTVYYRGRKDDIIKRFGNKINLQSIESTITQCPKVKTCSCIWLPKPLLLVVYFSSETLSSQELSDFLKCKLDDKHWPDKIIRVDDLPTNPHGKISKVILSKMYESTLSQQPTFDTLKDLFLKELKSSMNRSFSYNQIKDKDFFTIGGTSFLAVTMCNRLSLNCPQFGKLILPYLISPKYTIADIMQIAQKVSRLDDIKKKRKIKRSRSTNESCSEIPSHKKSGTIITSNLMEIHVMWSYDTGKCVDASPTLFQMDR